MAPVEEEVTHPDPAALSMDPVDAPIAEDAASAAGSEEGMEVQAGEELPKTGMMCCGFELAA